MICPEYRITRADVPDSLITHNYRTADVTLRPCDLLIGLLIYVLGRVEENSGTCVTEQFCYTFSNKILSDTLYILYFKVLAIFFVITLLHNECSFRNSTVRH